MKLAIFIKVALRHGKEEQIIFWELIYVKKEEKWKGKSVNVIPKSL